MAQNLGSAFGVIDIQTGQAGGAVTGLQRSIGGLSGGLLAINPILGATAIGLGGVAAAGAGLVTVIASSTKTAAEFEKGMSRVGALAGSTDEQLAMLEATAEKLGATTAFTATEAAEGMAFLAMAGFNTNEIIEAMPGLLDQAAAGQISLADAADITSNVLSGFGLEAEESGRVADVLTKTFTSANVDLRQLGDAMKFVAPIAATLGLSLEETSAAVGVLGDAGIQGTLAQRF